MHQMKKSCVCVIKSEDCMTLSLGTKGIFKGAYGGLEDSYLKKNDGIHFQLFYLNQQ